MRRYPLALLLSAWLLLTVFTTTGCDDTYEDAFLNPERSTEAKVPFLFTEAVLASEPWFDYGEGFWRFYDDIGAWSEITGTIAGEEMMRAEENEWSNLWNRYYTNSAMVIREMAALAEEMPAEEQQELEVYLVLGNILHAYNTAVVTDAFGDIPYSEAFTARSVEGRNLFPKFDSQESVYYALLDELKAASDRLRSGVTPHDRLSVQDIINKGDLVAWQRFANSLRLRYAMRISDVAPDKAREVVSDVLGGGLPIVESNEQNIIFETTTDLDSWGNRGRATRERHDGAFAPKVMIDHMVGNGDPRLEIYFDRSYNGEWKGLPSSPSEQPAEVSRLEFAFIDSLLNEQSPNYPTYMVTAAEVSLLQAEAFQRGWASGNAVEEYRTALEESVEMYYDLFNNNTAQVEKLDLDPAALDAFLAKMVADYKGLESIGMALYEHLWINDPYEAWATVRRTDQPNLGEERLLGGSVVPRTVRVEYPPSEQVNNRKNYEEQVAGKDQPTTRVWWDTK